LTLASSSATINLKLFKEFLMNTFLDWCGRNRTKIGYTIGGLNICLGLVDLFVGNYGTGFLWLTIGFLIITDTKGF